ncbi:type II toxin-antitoxin system prevent-host-death family antitoxin [Chelatococcus daeguensis]|uniref:Prevent-host-death family protein n=1 Tax=Chelatococcus sambhunathii TaxID=363953 RepID=A0ABM9TZ92_9HYPH|nr:MULTISPECIES: type II toxin-antitoxin system prevent-host-death family antitoxin [Chelatococcus]KZE27494.1 prevent-host-death protein [Chelatococcus daeguensis]MBM3085720.1 type II toxin-antitoxin system prevent-host-death family antitoxin [Chelatococcus daeguensis]CUA84496.1 prevent-host-death family protein [Chelatococcus sambhunathii]
MAQARKDNQVRVGVRELRANLSGLLRQARQGTSVLVMSRNEIIAEIGPPPGGERPRRMPGMLKGSIRMAPDFNTLPEEILSAMEGDAD